MGYFKDSAVARTCQQPTVYTDRDQVEMGEPDFQGLSTVNSLAPGRFNEIFHN